MNITAEQMLEALNTRAANDPLVREILRSAMYEVALVIEMKKSEDKSEDTGMVPEEKGDGERERQDDG